MDARIFCFDYGFHAERFSHFVFAGQIVSPVCKIRKETLPPLMQSSWKNFAHF
jgi:hypothetical protein